MTGRKKVTLAFRQMERERMTVGQNQTDRDQVTM